MDFNFKLIADFVINLAPSYQSPASLTDWILTVQLALILILWGGLISKYHWVSRYAALSVFLQALRGTAAQALKTYDRDPAWLLEVIDGFPLRFAVYTICISLLLAELVLRDRIVQARQGQEQRAKPTGHHPVVN